MISYKLRLFSLSLWTGLLVSVLSVAFGGVYFFNVSAQTEAVEKTAEQNLVNGRLAFTRTAFGSSPDRRILTSNPDGSGQRLLPISGNHLPSEPAWSPNGTKIAFTGTQSEKDIFVINADGSGQTNLTNTAPPMQESNPSWSVTGKIAYAVNAQTTDGQI